MSDPQNGLNDSVSQLGDTDDLNSLNAAGEGELLQLVSFVVGEEEFAVPILSVQEINRMMEITRVPQSPEYVEGVINLRGKIIPVIDLRKRFDMGELNDTADARIIVIEVAKRVIGFTVDRVNEVLRISSNIVEPPPTICSGVDTDYIQGVGKLKDRLLIMLNLEKLFSDYDADELARIASSSAAA
ncbi:chemotaxis protein CheW [Poriferisphaera sp. WC338]|uniref:chemotaxis protein CheW n=1 Tax=Poriferisphaera sp. WC338 TaxID=3425129 RepID=UPI003D81B4ED